MYLYIMSEAMFSLGNKEQAAFWYYIAQVRTRGYVKNDPDQSASPAFRDSLQDSIGPFINKWVGSDPDAWANLAIRSMRYEKKLSYPPKPSYISDEKSWESIVDGERTEYEKQFSELFPQGILKDKEALLAGRKKNGLYNGPWKESGAPLKDEWK